MHHFTWPTGRMDPDFERDARLCNLDAQTMQWNIWLAGGRLGFRPADHWFVFDFPNYDPPMASGEAQLEDDCRKAAAEVLKDSRRQAEAWWDQQQTVSRKR